MLSATEGIEGFQGVGYKFHYYPGKGVLEELTTRLSIGGQMVISNMKEGIGLEF